MEKKIMDLKDSKLKKIVIL